MAWKDIKKTGRKYGQKAKQFAKKRYFRKGKPSFANAKIMQMAKDVNMLKSMVNAEKKSVDMEKYIATVGQTGSGATGSNPTNSGHFALLDVFYTAQDSDVTNNAHRRHGNSIKCHSYHIDFRCKSKSNINAQRCTIYLVRFDREAIVSHLDLADLVLRPSVFDNKYDVHSPMNYENAKQFTVIAQRKVFIPADSDTGVEGTKYVEMGGKLGFHQRYLDGSASIDSNQFGILIVGDDGTQIGASSSRMEIEMAGTMYYYDN